jgi:hypothetical protein
MQKELKHLEGKLTLDVFEHMDLAALCVKHVPAFDRERYDIVALRVFAGQEFIVTVYAADKLNQNSTHPGKLMVKKFKIESILPMEFLSYIKSYNFTLANESYQFEDMEVINK